MKPTLTIFSLLLLSLLAACDKKVEYRGTPLVEVAGQCLYVEDLRGAQPKGLSPEDSIRYAERYIRNWVEEALLYERASRNVSHTEEIDDMVEQYRRTLVMHNYQQQLMEQKLSASITDEEIARFYANNKRLFTVEQPLVKGLFIKVPLGQAGLNNVRKWYQVNTPSNIENLEKFSLKGAVEYLYFYDHWVEVADLVDRIPFQMTDPVAHLKYNRTIELQDTRFAYFLKIDEYLDRGAEKPLDYARTEIQEILVHQKQVEFMRRVKEEMYERAERKQEIIYHYKASNEENK